MTDLVAHEAVEDKDKNSLKTVEKCKDVSHEDRLWINVEETKQPRETEQYDQNTGAFHPHTTVTWSPHTWWSKKQSTTEHSCPWVHFIDPDPTQRPTQHRYNEDAVMRQTANFHKAELLLPNAKLRTYICSTRHLFFRKYAISDPWPDPTNQLKTKIFDPLPTQPNPTHGSTEPMDNSAIRYYF